MPINWGLRRILGVNPEDRTCVGYAPSKKRRCTKPINRYDWPAACQLLDQMDRLEDLRDAIEDLEELAGLLLCNEWHNSQSRPQHSQVDKVYRKWKGVIEQYVRLREQEERATERQTQRIRAAEREREAERRVFVPEVRTDLGEEQLDAVRVARPISGLSPTEIANIDDPFVAQASSSRPNLFTHFAPINNNEEESEEDREDAILPVNLSSEEQNELPVGGDETPELPHMPSPPTQDHRIAIAEQEEISPVTAINIETSPMARFAVAFGSESASQVPFVFETPTRLETTQREILPSSGTTSFTSFSSSNFSMSTSSTATTPEKETPAEPKRIPLEEKAAKPMNVTLSSSSGTFSAYEFGSGRGRRFEFEAPTTPRKSPSPNDATPASALLFQFTNPGDNDPEAPSTSTQPSERPGQPDIAPSAPINEAYTNDFVAQPITPPRNNAESFGYANVTPNSTRYTTYLPVRQQYGLMTPPETPEMLMGALDIPLDGSGYFRDESSRESGSPHPRVTRKPLPRPSPLAAEAESEGRAEICAACGREGRQEAGDCGCGEDYEGEFESRAGCLERFGFRRLKEKVVGRLAGVGRRISRRNENEILHSSNENL